MKTLFVVPSTLGPPDTGRRQRLNHLLRAVASVSDVTLVCAVDSGSDNLDAWRSLCASVHTFSASSLGFVADRCRSTPSTLLKFVQRHLNPGRPALIDASSSGEAAELVRGISEKGFDLIWADSLPALSMVPPDVRCRVIVNLYDIEHCALRHLLRKEHFGPATPVRWLEYLKLKRFERGLTRLPLELLVCSELDRQRLGNSGRIRVVPNGVEIPPAGNTKLDAATRPGFIFVGTMYYPPNVDAAHYFTREILPLIRREEPEARFVIVGKDPSPELLRLEDGKSVVVTGTVPDVGPWLQDATVAVVPIRHGGGTRIKILEAMAHRRPIVSTTIGAEGLEVQSGRDILLADKPEVFARSCLRLVRDANLREMISRCGFELVRSRYDWKIIERDVAAVVARTGERELETRENVRNKRVFTASGGAN